MGHPRFDEAALLLVGDVLPDDVDELRQRDIGRLAQCRPGESVRFESVSIDVARAELFAALGEVRASLAAAIPISGAGFSSEFLLSQNLISGAQNAAEET